MSNELKTVWLLIICATVLWLAEINHQACLTGHDIDAKIQQHFQETTDPTTTPTEKEPTP